MPPPIAPTPWIANDQKIGRTPALTIVTYYPLIRETPSDRSTPTRLAFGTFQAASRFLNTLHPRTFPKVTYSYPPHA